MRKKKLDQDAALERGAVIGKQMFLLPPGRSANCSSLLEQNNGVTAEQRFLDPFEEEMFLFGDMDNRGSRVSQLARRCPTQDMASAQYLAPQSTSPQAQKYRQKKAQQQSQ